MAGLTGFRGDFRENGSSIWELGGRQVVLFVGNLLMNDWGRLRTSSNCFIRTPFVKAPANKGCGQAALDSAVFVQYENRHV